ncbi:MAG: enzyme of heme biosynthesis [Methylococcales symbiont of Iophon sp. n. MRB-2018]|nr:MAG: enzyme of heme biosynthesis [Methylococcales symbiont of Iophon sp. n. MRB-2018]KAF3980336.1 MAG: enzyme of heme biosynthesis [Methylococcales symbiont of Iophon sp. n. MRB-2018]
MAKYTQKEAEQENVSQVPVEVEAVIKEQLQKQETENQPTDIAVKNSKGWLIFGTINLLLILLIAGALFYLIQETKDKQLAQGTEISKDDLREIEVSKHLNVLQTQLGTMQSQIATFAEDITGKDNHFTKTLADFSQLHSEKMALTKIELLSEIDQIKRQLGKTRGDWLIADAEYLLSVANQRLHLVGDVKTASLALEAADQRLRESGDASVFKIREQLTKEIAALTTINTPDVVGIYSKIQLLKDNSGQLAVLLPYAGKPLTASKQIHAHKDGDDGHGVLSSTLKLLEGYVTVRHSDRPITQILTDEEVGFIRQQLNVKLEMIKIALVQQNDALYKASIVDTKNWLNDQFTINIQAQKFIAVLDAISAIPMRSAFPDISQSFKMLKDIVKLRLEMDKAQLTPLKEKNKVATEQAIVAPITP